jgi:uncharacterized membrane protein (DUF485 family)
VVNDDRNFIVYIGFMKSSSFNIDLIDYREIAEILATFGGVTGSVMIVYNFVFMSLLSRMFNKQLNKLQEK